MMEIEIIEAGISDLPLLMEWRMRVIREVFSLPEDEDLSLLERANRHFYEESLREGRYIACFATITGTARIVGCGGMCLYREMPSPDNPSGECAYLMNIFSAPEYRRCGIGEKTVRWLIARAKERGASKIYLETTPSGRPLYEKIGFVDMKDYMSWRG